MRRMRGSSIAGAIRYAIAPFYEEIRPAWPISAWRPVLGAILAARPGWATLGNWNPPSIRADLKPTPVYRLRSSYTAGLPHGIYQLIGVKGAIVQPLS